MSTYTLFELTFWLAVPFWALMIIAPRWTVSRRIMASSWSAAVPLLTYFALALPHFSELWNAVSRPDLDVLRAFAGTPYGAATFWAHLISFDLFLGRWMYFDARERNIHPLVMAPVLLLTILLSPFGVLLYLLIRRSPWRDVVAGKTESAIAGSR